MENETIFGGAFMVARQLFGSEVWLKKPATWKVIWLYILGRVSHGSDKRYQRGEGFFNFAEERRNIGIDIKEDMIKKFLVFARDSSMVSTTRSTRGMVIKVLNYEKFQDMGSYLGTKRGTKEAREKHERSTPIYKNEKNVNNEKNPESEGEAVALRAPTPSQVAANFFVDPNMQQQAVDAMVAKKFDPGVAREEVSKFIHYWTEPTPSGKKQKWQIQKTFEVSRRLVTWIGNLRNRSHSSVNVAPKGVVL